MIVAPFAQTIVGFECLVNPSIVGLYFNSKHRSYGTYAVKIFTFSLYSLVPGLELCCQSMIAFLQPACMPV